MISLAGAASTLQPTAPASVMQVIRGRGQEALDEAVRLIGRNVTGVRGDAANLDDLDRLFDTVKREKGKIDVLYTSAGTGEAVPLGEITEQHFDAAFNLNARGTLFTVQKTLPLFNEGGSIIMTGCMIAKALTEIR